MSNLGPVNDSQRRLREDLWARHLPYKKKAQKEQSVNQPHLGHKLILNWGWGNTGFTFPLFEMESSRTNGKKEGVGDWPPYRGVNKWDNECENEVSQLCPTLCDPMDCSLPHSLSVARVLEWVAISFSRGSSQPRDQTWVFPIVGRRFTIWATREVTKWVWRWLKSYMELWNRRRGCYSFSFPELSLITHLLCGTPSFLTEYANLQSDWLICNLAIALSLSVGEKWLDHHKRIYNDFSFPTTHPSNKHYWALTIYGELWWKQKHIFGFLSLPRKCAN